jgi:hypothetical protein
MAAQHASLPQPIVSTTGTTSAVAITTARAPRRIGCRLISLPSYPRNVILIGAADKRLSVAWVLPVATL